jgi:hypothetical protein
MADISGGSASFFSEDTYQSFVEHKSYIHNERLRGEDETIFDAALSEEADFRKHPEGDKILETIRNYK